MFDPANWCGLWFCITVLCGYGAKRLAKRHKKQVAVTEERQSEEVQSDDDDLLYLEEDAVEFL